MVVWASARKPGNGTIYSFTRAADRRPPKPTTPDHQPGASMTTSTTARRASALASGLARKSLTVDQAAWA